MIQSGAGQTDASPVSRGTHFPTTFQYVYALTNSMPTDATKNGDHIKLAGVPRGQLDRHMPCLSDYPHGIIIKPRLFYAFPRIYRRDWMMVLLACVIIALTLSGSTPAITVASALTTATWGVPRVISLFRRS